jgi:hypothetical protein
MHVYFESCLTPVLRLAIGGPLLPQERSSEFPVPARQRHPPSLKVRPGKPI